MAMPDTQQILQNFFSFVLLMLTCLSSSKQTTEYLSVIICGFECYMNPTTKVP